jgi:hypothetical protein
MTNEGFKRLIARRYTNTADGIAGTAARLVEREAALHQVITESFSIAA